LKRKILKKLRTASLNSEFTGSYKKGYTYVLAWISQDLSIMTKERCGLARKRHGNAVSVVHEKFRVVYCPLWTYVGWNPLLEDVVVWKHLIDRGNGAHKH